MAKKRADNTPAAAQPAAKPAHRPQRPAANGPTWRPAWRLLVSCLVIFHLLAVFAAPWDLATGAALPPGYLPPSDNLGRPMAPAPEVWQEPVVPRALRSCFNHYLNLLYLNHGYEFFAPDPMGTHVIDYLVRRPDGTTVAGRFPDVRQQWPRLLYHRHMMLAEQSEMINNQLVLMAEQTGVRRPFSGQVFAEYLATSHQGTANLDLKIHQLLPPARVAAGTRLDDPSTYRTLGTVSGQPRESAARSRRGVAEEPIAIPGASP